MTLYEGKDSVSCENVQFHPHISGTDVKTVALLDEDQQDQVDDQPQPVAMRSRCHVTMLPFSVYAGSIGLVTSALSSYLGSQITTLEKQFGWRSAESALIMAMNDIGFFTSILIITYFCRQSHIPRILAVCTFLFGVGAFISALPHVLTLSSTVVTNSTVVTPTSRALSVSSVCRDSQTAEDIESEGCSLSETNHFSHIKTASFCLLASGMFLQGVVKSPRIPLALTYIDDNVSRSKTALYSGISLSLLILGYTLAFAMGAAFSTVYVTLEDTDMTPRDPQWIGAWWLGFVILGTTAIVVSIPLCFFPKRLSLGSNRGQDAQPRSYLVRTMIKQIPETTSRLMRNRVYVLLVLGFAIKSLRNAGFAAFNPKYMEVSFGLSVFEANVLGGVSAAGALTVSLIISGFIMSHFKMEFRGFLLMAVTCEVISSVLFLSGITISCPPPDILGLNNTSSEVHTSGLFSATGTSACTSGCNCEKVDYFPICGVDNITYFSPCHAGCTLMSDEGAAGCRCITNRTDTLLLEPDVDAVPGVCTSQCEAHLLFTIIQSLAWFSTGISGLSVPIAILRCVHDRDKSIASGVSTFMNSLIGWCLGPIVFGNVIDTTCRLWQESCSVKGACAIYDTTDLRIKYHVLDAIISFVYIAIFTLAYLCKMKKIKF